MRRGKVTLFDVGATILIGVVLVVAIFQLVKWTIKKHMEG